MRNLRVQLLAGHLLALAVMLAAMVGSVYSFFHLGRSIDRIMEDNYRSVTAAQAMKDALERLDNSATLVLAGEKAKARSQCATYSARFEAAHRDEANNITEAGEQELSDSIGAQFVAYRSELERFVAGDAPGSGADARRHYVVVLEPAFERLKQQANRVLVLNQNAIIRANRRAKAEATRASWTAVVTTLAARILAMLGAVVMVRRALGPLRALAARADEIGGGRLDPALEVRGSDEIASLSRAFNRMAERLQAAKAADQRRLHRAELMSVQALQCLYDPVVVTDAESRVVHLNRAAEALFGPEPGALGAQASAVVRDERIAAAVERAVSDGRTTAADDYAGGVVLRDGGRQRAYRLRSTPILDDDGATLGAVVALEDETFLRDVDRLKTEFISVASHELRTPVTSLLLSVQLMQEGAVGPLSGDQLEVVAAQREDLERLDRLTRDLLDTARMDSGRMAPRLATVAVCDLLSDAAEAVAAQAQARGVSIDVNVEPGLCDAQADRSQVARALVNLLSNAVRYTPERGAVTLAARASQSGAADVEIIVTDAGPGIPPDYLPRIFDRFVQVPGAARGGAGLGLAIARTIARAHGGDIRAVSRLGSGSTFTLTLPDTQGAMQSGAAGGA